MTTGLWNEIDYWHFWQHMIVMLEGNFMMLQSIFYLLWGLIAISVIFDYFLECMKS